MVILHLKQRIILKGMPCQEEYLSAATMQILEGLQNIPFKRIATINLKRLTFCGVGAHHQNRIVECKIKKKNIGFQDYAAPCSTFIAGIYPKYAIALCLAGCS